jgi:hypothetical protein
MSDKPPNPKRRRNAVVVLVFLVVVAAVALVVTDPFSTGGGGSGVADNAYPTSLQAVIRGPISSQTEVDATLGFSGSYTVVNQAAGSVSALPGVGDVVTEGQSLYALNGTPVVLLYGSEPAYRSLSVGMSGSDVAQLNGDLISLGDASSSQLGGDIDYFSSATAAAVDELQANTGSEQTGELVLGQAVFLPSAARITAVEVTGGAVVAAGSTVATASSTDKVISVALDSAQQSEVAVGDPVTITLPDNDTTPGVVTTVGKVATASSSGSTVTVLVKLSDPGVAANLQQAPVEVAITTASVADALVVPVDALLALGSGGYAVEVAERGGARHLVAVSLGLFDDADGTVQVTGDLEPGMRVVVPGL